MMKLYLFLSAIIAIVLFPGSSFAQCDPGEVELEIIIHTDAYGYEGYWELVPEGNNCGTGTIASGGNVSVGCNGAGDQNQAPGGYGNNLMMMEGPWCVEENASFDLIYVDDWGDGGFMFEVMVNGYNVTSFMGMGLGGTYTFQASMPPAFDLSVTESNLLQYVESGDFEIECQVFNHGTETVTSFDLNYSINGGGPVTSTINDANLGNYDSEHYTHPTAWTITDNGVYDIEIWASNINGGNADGNPDNDIFTTQVEAGPGIPNILDDFVDTPIMISEIAGPAELVNLPTDLDFHPVLSNKELWVINKDTENTGGSTVTIYNAGEDNQSEIWKRDGNAWHFMSLPTGIAFSENGFFANSPGVYDANHNGGDAFTGPALWSSDMDIYAEPSGGNGSHMDMLHESPYCQGIAAETGNAFWVFDGYNNDIVRYDFVDDHGPGNDDHSDGIIHRFSDDEVAMDDNHEVVSHLVLDENKQWLYVVDYGNQRIFRIDITTGTPAGTPDYGPFEPLAEYLNYSGYTQEAVVSSGLSRPAGIDVIDDRMIVSEFETGEIIIYDISSMPATELDRFETGFSSLQGIKIGPDGFIWGVDHNTATVYKAMPEFLSSVDDTNAIAPRFYPNPTVDWVTVDRLTVNAEIRIFSSEGKLVKTQRTNSDRTEIDLSDLTRGIYSVQLIHGNSVRYEQIVKQ